MQRFATIAWLLACAVAMPFNVPVVAQETVSFPSADGTRLTAKLFRPSGAGPFPAIVALHGCGGLAGARDTVSPRHRDWSERLSGLGYLVLMPDSFASRGLGPQCGTARREVRPGRERVADANGARRYLAARPDVIRARIALLGWSNGGSTVLWTVRRGGGPARGEPDFARAIAFYPGCRIPAESGHVPRLPLLILMGEADDWTPIAPCRAYVTRARAVGANARLIAYPGAYHDFDNPTARVRRRTGLAFTGGGTGEAMVGHDPAAYADAIRRVPEFLAGR